MQLTYNNLCYNWEQYNICITGIPSSRLAELLPWQHRMTLMWSLMHPVCIPTTSSVPTPTALWLSTSTLVQRSGTTMNCYIAMYIHH